MSCVQKTYEYGVRLDVEARGAFWDQAIMARRLYNELIAVMRGIYDEMQGFVLEQAGSDAVGLMARIQVLNEAFKVARADDDEKRMKAVATDRRNCWSELSPLLKAVRARHKDEIRERFLLRIGNNSRTDTYPVRCRYVDEGLGFGTATAVLDRALKAWKDSMTKGRPPMFSSAVEKRQDTLVLQFTKAGGVPVESIMTGQSKELAIDANPGRRRYGTFVFRLGAAKAKIYATGEIQLHRPLPEGSRIPGARLVCEKVANGEEYRLQLIVSDSSGGAIAHDNRKPLLAVHFGWAAADGGRHIATINNTPDPSTAQYVLLPESIEDDLERSAAIQSARDTARDELRAQLSQWPMTGDEELDAEISAIQKLPAQYISQARLHKLIERCWREGYENQPEWLREWKSLDKQRWQATVGLARRARNRRNNFYAELALDWCSQYQAVVIEPLSLKDAAVVVDENTGERSEFTKKARAGRVVAAVSELVTAIRWQAIKHGVALFEDNPATVSTCSHCGSTRIIPSTDKLLLCCSDCGAETGRKANAAAVLFQLHCVEITEKTVEYHIAAVASENARLLKKTSKMLMMQEGRRKARMGNNDDKNQ